MPLRAARNFGGAPATGFSRRRRYTGAHDHSPESWSGNGGLVRAILRRQATGGRRRLGGPRAGVGPREILSAKGEFRKRVRQQLEGVPEMIADIKKALTSGDHSALTSAVLAARNKLIEGRSAQLDLPVGNSSSRGSGGGGGGGGSDGQHRAHRHGDDDDDDPYNPNSYRQTRRVDRDAFIALGGADLLLQVLRGPGIPADARLIPAEIVGRDTAVWTMALVILRELCFTDQDLSERLGSSELILFLLTLMAHPGVFDHAVGLVEEILAVKSTTYFLGDVPRLHSLIENMSSQQLAHFSRVLALLVFEPEYRQLMESAHVLRSMELLQLRRDRVVRADSIIDKNQALILSAPNLLKRLMELLRVMNFNPPLAMLDERALEMHDTHIAHVRISLVTGGDRSSTQQQVNDEWEYLAELRETAESLVSPPFSPAYEGSAPSGGLLRREQPENPRRPNNEPNRFTNFFRSIFRMNQQPQDPVEPSAESEQAPRAARTARAASAPAAVRDDGGRGAVTGREVAGETVGVTSDRVNAAVGRIRAAAAQLAEQNVEVAGSGFRADIGQNFQAIDIDRIPEGRRMRAALERADATANFAIRDLLSFLNPSIGGSDPSGSVVTLEEALSWPGSTLPNGLGRRRLDHPTREEAREELQFNGLLLAPHQVEVLFVLCTLLGARRKGEAHQTLANLGLIDVLNVMFDRLSWGTPPRQEGPHGAHCDCNPESALRVQYLRLVHNFLDRDSNNNPLKRLLLSPQERQLFATGRFMPDSNGSVVFVKDGTPESEAVPSFVWRGRESSGVHGESEEERAKWVDTRGLLSKIVDVFMKEPMDSLYRFWLASCVEAFLRGGSTQEQLFIAGSGLLPHLVTEITSDGLWCSGSLQTAFDLLGELCKGNIEVLELLEACMSQKQLHRFIEVMVDNLVDSNVFMRSLVLSVDHSGFRKQFLEKRFSQRATGTRKGAAASKSGKGRQSETMGSGRNDEVGNEDDEPCYLGHTWYDVQPREVKEYSEGWEGGDSEKDPYGAAMGKGNKRVVTVEGNARARRGEESAVRNGGGRQEGGREGVKEEDNAKPKPNGVYRRFDRSWFFESEESAWAPRARAGAPLGVERGLTRLQDFLRKNTPQLMRDLMSVVSLETINHENICCLNTAVLILIFADRRGQLAELLEDVRQLPPGRGKSRGTDVLQEIVLELNDVQQTSEEQHRKMSPLELSRDNLPDGADEAEGKTLPQDGEAALRGFRRLLWFWSEYYLRGGRDRLSLEFSTHVKFWAWKRVIGLLCADDGSPTALVDEPISLPRSPFEVVASCPYPPHDLLR